MHFLELPDDCLRCILEIYDHKLLTSLISKISVHPRFVSIVGQILRTRQKSLKLFDSRLGVDFYRDNVLDLYNLRCFSVNDDGIGLKHSEREEDYLVIRELTDEPVEWIHELLNEYFFDITNLMIHSNVLDHITLLQKHSTSLTTLTLVELPPSTPMHNEIWKVLNSSLPQLTHLHLSYQNVLIPIPDQATVLGQLESFTLVNYEHPLTKVIHQLSTKCRALRLNLTSAQKAVKLVDNMKTGDVKLCKNIAHLDIRLPQITELPHDRLYASQLPNFVGRYFSTLTYLDVEFAEKMPYFDVFHALSSLTNLTELRIAPGDFIKRMGQYVNNELLSVSESVPNLRKPWHTAQLASLRKMYLVKFFDIVPPICRYNEILYQMIQKQLHEVRYNNERDNYRQRNVMQNVKMFPALEQVCFEVRQSRPNCVGKNEEDYRIDSPFWPKFSGYIRGHFDESWWSRCKVYHTVEDVLVENLFV